MKCNVGKTDRAIRIILGFVIIGVCFYFKSWWGLVGLLLLLSGVIGYCGLYTILKISTCKTKG